MKAENITPETFPKALRTLRLRAGLSQHGLALRTLNLKPPLRPLTLYLISAIECGARRPPFAAVLIILVGCSADGESLDLSLLQQAIEIDDDPEEPMRERPVDGCQWDTRRSS